MDTAAKRALDKSFCATVHAQTEGKFDSLFELNAVLIYGAEMQI